MAGQPTLSDGDIGILRGLLFKPGGRRTRIATALVLGIGAALAAPRLAVPPAESHALAQGLPGCGAGRKQECMTGPRPLDSPGALVIVLRPRIADSHANFLAIQPTLSDGDIAILRGLFFKPEGR